MSTCADCSAASASKEGSRTGGWGDGLLQARQTLGPEFPTPTPTEMPGKLGDLPAISAFPWETEIIDLQIILKVLGSVRDLTPVNKVEGSPGRHPVSASGLYIQVEHICVCVYMCVGTYVHIYAPTHIHLGKEMPRTEEARENCSLPLSQEHVPADNLASDFHLLRCEMTFCVVLSCWLALLQTASRSELSQLICFFYLLSRSVGSE